MAHDKDFETKEGEELDTNEGKKSRKKMTKEQDKEHDRARKRISQQFSNEESSRKKMLEVLRFVRVPGAMWEGSTNADWSMETDRFKKYPRFELNKLAREVDRIITEYRMNRVNVTFRPKDGEASEELADKMNGKFRADFNESSGCEAIDNAFDDAVTGGFGCFRMDTCLEDEYNPDSESRHITFHPVYDPASCVFFDQNSKQYDRSDALWATELYSIDNEAYAEQYPTAMAPESLEMLDTGKQFDWCTPDAVYLARYYEKRIEDVTVISYQNPITQETAVYEEDQIEDIKDELKENGFEKGKSRKVKKARIYCGILSGGEWLEPMTRIPGCHIPLIPIYARRSFVDNLERISGHATLATDAQRLENLIVSMMADNATQAGGDNIPILDINTVPGPLADAWGNRNRDRPAYLPVDSLRDDQGNIIAAGNVISYTPSTPLSPALSAIVQYTGSTIQQIVGASQMENMPSNLATETVEAIFQRMDGQSALYMDNLSKSLRHAGQVWLEMAREVYGSIDYVRIVKEDGSDDLVMMQGAILDRQTKEKIALNDLTKGRYEVESNVGQSSQTRRQATVRTLTNLLQSMNAQDSNASIVMSLILMNLDGEGLQDFREYTRNQLILNGIIKAESDEEKTMLQEAQQAQQEQNNKGDPNMELAKAEQMKGQAQMMDAENKRMDLQLKDKDLNIKALTMQVNAEKAAKDGRLTDARTLETIAKTAGIKHNQLVEVLRLMQQFSNDQQAADERNADRLLSAAQQQQQQQY